jgi:hypothetical protein
MIEDCQEKPTRKTFWLKFLLLAVCSTLISSPLTKVSVKAQFFVRKKTPLKILFGETREEKSI